MCTSYTRMSKPTFPPKLYSFRPTKEVRDGLRRFAKPTDKDRTATILRALEAAVCPSGPAVVMDDKDAFTGGAK